MEPEGNTTSELCAVLNARNPSCQGSSAPECHCDSHRIELHTADSPNGPWSRFTPSQDLYDGSIVSCESLPSQPNPRFFAKLHFTCLQMVQTRLQSSCPTAVSRWSRRRSATIQSLASQGRCAWLSHRCGPRITSASLHGRTCFSSNRCPKSVRGRRAGTRATETTSTCPSHHVTSARVRRVLPVPTAGAAR